MYAIFLVVDLTRDMMTFAQAQKYFDTIADFTSDCSFVSSKKPLVMSTLEFRLPRIAGLMAFHTG